MSLIGESGSGKSTIGKMILRLLRTTQGAIAFDGVDISTLEGRRLREYYSHVQGVFQDPFSSYNPIFKADRVFTMLRSEYFPGLSGSEWRTKLERSLDDVSLNPGDVLNKYPHQLSGGQLQRMLIARALLLDIRLLVADEIISMLDASTRIDVLNLLGDLKARGLGILFITHDLSLGNYISDTTMILRRGVVVEMGATERVFGNPLHPYTRSLVASVPQLHRKWKDLSSRRCAPDADGCATKLVQVEDDHFVAPARGMSAVENTASRRFRGRNVRAGSSGRALALEPQPDHRARSVPRANSIFNSAVVRFGDGFAGVFRVDDTRRVMNLHAGRSADGVDWEIDARADRVRAGGRAVARSGAVRARVRPARDVARGRYYVTWCNGYHGPTIGIALHARLRDLRQLENAFLPFNRNGVLFPRTDRRRATRCSAGRATTATRRSATSSTRRARTSFTGAGTGTCWRRSR